MTIKAVNLGKSPTNIEWKLTFEKSDEEESRLLPTIRILYIGIQIGALVVK